MLGAFVTALLCRARAAVLVGARRGAGRESRSGSLIERAFVPRLAGARPALQLPAHVRPHADPAGPGQAPVHRQRGALEPRRCSPASSTSACVPPLGLPGVRVRPSPCASACSSGWLLTRTRIGMVVRASTERRAHPGPRHRRLPLGHAGLRLRHRSGRPLRRAGRADAGDQPVDGGDLIIVVFAVVVIGGLGSIFGSVVAGFRDRADPGLGQAYAPALRAGPRLRRHGRRAARAPGRAVRTGGAMA